MVKTGQIVFSKLGQDKKPIKGINNQEEIHKVKVKTQLHSQSWGKIRNQ
jgi:hypothetical protein